MAQQEATNSLSHRSLLFRIQKFGYRKFPTLIPDPELHERLTIYQRGDKEDNTKSELPENEVIDLQCIWAIELYTPSQISKLIHNFDKLGWNKDDLSGEDRNPALWLQRSRDGSFGGAWFNLGTIRRQGEKNKLPFEYQAPLPPGVEYAYASIYCLTSSITCVVVAFVLDESQNNRFEQALRCKRKTYIKPIPKRGHSIIGPEIQKENAIKEIRLQLRQLVSEWFRTYLPGFFASKNLNQEYPTCELLTLLNSLPCPSRENRNKTNDTWLHILDIHDDFTAWQSDSLNGLKFVWPLRSKNDNPYHAIVVVRQKDFSDKQLELYGGKNRHSITFYIDEAVRDLLSRWALVSLLSDFERYLNNLRDSDMFDPKHRVKPLHLLKGIGRHLPQSVDIGAVSAELQEFAKSRYLFRQDITDFYACFQPLNQVDKTMLRDVLKDHIKERSEWIRNVDRRNGNPCYLRRAGGGFWAAGAGGIILQVDGCRGACWYLFWSWRSDVHPNSHSGHGRVHHQPGHRRCVRTIHGGNCVPAAQGGDASR